MNSESAEVKPRLLVVASTYPRWQHDPEPGFVHELAKRLTATFDVRVLCPHAQGAHRRECMDGVEVVRFRYAPDWMETLVNSGGITANVRKAPWKWALVPLFMLAQLWALSRQILTWRPRVVHAHWIIPQGALVALLGGLGLSAPRFVVTSHGADLFAFRGPLFGQVKKFVLNRASAITVVSWPMLAEVVGLGAPVEKVRVEPMGVDVTHRFVPNHPSSVVAGRLLFVGRLVEKKGLAFLIDALPEIRSKCPEVTLQIAGFGPEEPNLRLQVERLGLSDRVQFLGAVKQDDLPRIYGSAAVFVAPFIKDKAGDEEGLGLVAVEALACGRPVVLGSVDAVRSSFGSLPGVTLVDPRDRRQLVDACLASLRVLSLSVEERSRAIAKFDWDSRAESYARILMAACVGGRIADGGE